MFLASAADFWLTIVLCAASFVCGMWLKDKVMTWINRG